MRCPTLHDLPPPPPGKTGWPWTEESTQAPELTPSGDAWPRISIVTPSYNQGEFIEETIRSVLLQGYPDLEYIVIDGGSTDNSVEIIRRYAPWLTYWFSEPDRGQANAINKGFEHATGTILGYLNSDDVYWPGGLVALIEQAIRGNAIGNNLLAGAVQDLEASGLGKVFRNACYGTIQQWLDLHQAIRQPGCFWSKDVWDTCGPFRDNLDFVFDRYFFTTCRIKGIGLFTADYRLACFRLHASSKTTRYQFATDRFTPEWEKVRPDLERTLSPLQRAGVSFARNLEENWRLVSAAMQERFLGPGSGALLDKVMRNPLWVLHRPVAGALVRLGARWFAQTAK